MTQSSTFKIVQGILLDVLGATEEEIAPDTSLLSELGIDSLDQVEIFLELESQFEINGSPEDFWTESIDTVQNLVDRIDGLIK